MFPSSTRDIPAAAAVPRHVAIIMDGNGRWAKQRMLPRVAGHRRGVEAVRAIILACIELDIEFLTLFAFSSENWRRPQDEVSILMYLFLRALEQEVAKLHENGIRFRVVGDLVVFIGSAMAVPPGKNVEYAGGGAGKVVFDGKVHADKGKKCNDCHTKIFQMKKGAALKMADMNAGKQCGECHNGTVAFATKDAANCAKCHKK